MFFMEKNLQSSVTFSIQCTSCKFQVLGFKFDFVELKVQESF